MTDTTTKPIPEVPRCPYCGRENTDVVVQLFDAEDGARHVHERCHNASMTPNPDPEKLKG
jgi:hypothetical protein